MHRQSRVLLVLTIFFAANRVNAETVLFFTSSPTNFIGMGATRTITPVDHIFTATRKLEGDPFANSVRLKATNKPGGVYDYWALDLIGSEDSLPVVGEYFGAGHYPGQSLHQPGMRFYGNGRDETLTSSQFIVLEAVYDASSQIQKFAVDFLQIERGDPARWIHGSFRYNSTIPVTVPEPPTSVLGMSSALFGLAIVLRRNRHRVASH